MDAHTQGSGWGWLGYSPELKHLVITTTANQDPLTTQVSPKVEHINDWSAPMDT